MSLSHLPAWMSDRFFAMAAWLHKKSAGRLPVLLLGILFASGRRTVTSWFRAADIGADFRCGYSTVWAAGRQYKGIAISVYDSARPLLGSKRLLGVIDDTPTARYGPCVEGAGVHRNPTPGPAGEKYVYGHIWVTLAVLAKHPHWDSIALPMRAELYVRKKDIDSVPPERRPAFRTKLEMAAEQIKWLALGAKPGFEEVWSVFDGAYAKRPVLKAAKAHDVVVVSRLPRNAALWCLPETVRRKGQRGPMPTYGKRRIVLAMRAGHKEGWQQVQCRQYGEVVTKKVKTFLATWRPAGGLIRVVLVMEDDGWRAYFCTGADATAEEILEAAADRGAIEQTFKDAKEVYGAGQQQVRDLDANVGCFNLNLWMYTLVEAWAWGKDDEELVDRSQSPWYEDYYRPSHQDKRKALQRLVLREEIDEALRGRPTKVGFRELAERLLRLAA